MSIEALQLTALVFCRIAGCMAVAVGFASMRVPVLVRAFASVTFTVCIAPAIEAGGPFASPELLRMLLVELVVGLLLGLCTRMFMAAVEVLSAVAAAILGFGPVGGVSIEGAEPASTLHEPLLLSAIAFAVANDFHIIMVRALLDSFEVRPVGARLAEAGMLAELVRTLRAGFACGLQMAGPLVLFGLTVNLILGIAARMLPQSPLQFGGTPLMTIGGLMLLAGGLSSWLAWLAGLLMSAARGQL